jgi:hypothetical protein
MYLYAGQVSAMTTAEPASRRDEFLPVGSNQTSCKAHNRSRPAKTVENQVKKYSKPKARRRTAAIQTMPNTRDPANLTSSKESHIAIYPVTILPGAFLLFQVQLQ